METVHTFVDVLRHRSMFTGDQTAFVFLPDGETERDTLTYAQLNHQAQVIARQLVANHGLTKGDRALLLYPQGLEFITAFLGCLYAGVVAVPVAIIRQDPQKDQQVLDTIAADSQATVALTDEAFAQHLDLSTLTVILPSDTSTSDISPEHATSATPTNEQKTVFPQLTPETLAFLQYTSGSTGKPKGVMVTHQNLLHNAQLIELATRGVGQKQETIVGWLPFHHDMGLIGSVLQPIYLGDRAVIMPPLAFLQKPIRWLQAISHYQATTSGGPNFAYDLCLIKSTSEQRDQLDLTSWKVAFTGAEAVNPHTLDRFSQAFAASGFRRAAFYPCYGMAEATLMISGGQRDLPPTEVTVSLSALEQNQVVESTDTNHAIRRIVSCGRAWLEQSIQIVNPTTRRPCSAHQVGEIWVSGASITQGYWHKTEATQATFGAVLSGSESGPSNQNTFLRTGDLGFMHEGELFITGRLKDMIIVRGRNYYPQDLEATVHRCYAAAGPNSCAAFSIEREDQERVVIVQEIASAKDLDFSDIAKSIRAQIAERHGLQAHAIVLIAAGSLPKTASNKVQRSACKQAFLTDSFDAIYQDILPVQPADTQVDNQAMPSLSSLLSLSNDRSVSAAHLQQWLVTRLANTLQRPTQEIDIVESFAAYGIDSSSAVSMTDELAEALHQELDPMIFWEYPSIEKLSIYLSELCEAPKPIATV